MATLISLRPCCFVPGRRLGLLEEEVVIGRFEVLRSVALVELVVEKTLRPGVRYEALPDVSWSAGCDS